VVSTSDLLNTRPFVPGASFRNGRLVAFSSQGVVVVHAWPRLAAWVKTASRPQWRGCRPHLDVRSGRVYGPGNEPEKEFRVPVRPRPLFHVGREETFRLFAETVPADLRNRIGRFRSRHWHLLALARRCPGGADLFETNPALAYAVASNWVFHPVSDPMRSARSLVRCRQCVAAGRLGFPETESTARILARIPAGCVSISGLMYLRTAMRDPDALQLLRHCRRINVGVLRIVTDPALRPWASATLLAEVSAQPEEHLFPETALILRDTIVAGAEDPVALAPRPYRSLGQLARRHDALELGFVDRAMPAQWARLAFPPPPLPGALSIRPLGSPEELRIESREQYNCVVSYAPRVARGGVYIYSVLHPERATLELRRRGDRWALSQLRIARNGRASRATYDVVRAWIARQ